MKRIVWLALILGGLAACGGAAGPAAGIQVEDVWARSAPASAPNGAFYLTLRNRGQAADSLLQAESPVCQKMELHRSVLGENGVMRMEAVPGGQITLPAGEEVRLEVGGLHLMCLGKKGALEAGGSVPLRLEFAHAGTLTLEAAIR